MEHFSSDINNIKVSLKKITKYILNKSVERGKVNNFENLNNIGKVAWKFISSLYDSGWDALCINNNILFRSKVMSKFTPKINNIPKNKESKETEKLVSVLSLSSPIPMKSPKKVKDIVKYFKRNDNYKSKETARKSYAQALSSGNGTKEVLKIKEKFLNLQSNKIKNIQKIINGSNKPKPCLNMTTKGPLCKQVIVPMNSDNMVKFMSSSSDHIININRLLKNIKSECKADYIRAKML